MGTRNEPIGRGGQRRETPSGLPLEAVYPIDDRSGGPSGDPSRVPGEYPFTRGIHPEMYRRRLWTIRQYAGFGDAAETNRRFHFLLGEGQTGLSVAFDLPTQIGYDSDEAISLGEVGRVGVPISTADDMDDLLRDLPLESISISMTINSTAAMLLAFLVTIAERRGVPLTKLRGTLQNDMLKEFIARRTYRFPVEPSLRVTADIFQFCQENMPKWNPISISGYHMREAGCNAPQEIAFTLANAIAYVDLASKRALALEPLTRQLSFFWAAHNHVLEEVAKFRAARRMWAHIVRDRLGIDDPQCARMRFHVQTAGSTLTPQEPENNVIRVTLQAVAAVLGGTQSLHTNGMDEALTLPSETSARTALRTQQIIAHESGLADVADPLGGAPAIERLTEAIEERAAQILEAIERRGGALQAVEDGYQQALIEEEAYREFRAVESGERIVVGVNRYQSAQEVAPSTARPLDHRWEKARLERLAAFRARRSDSAVSHARRALEEGARSDDNILVHLIECAKSGVTIGEMSTTLTAVFGEYRE